MKEEASKGDVTLTAEQQEEYNRIREEVGRKTAIDSQKLQQFDRCASLVTQRGCH